MQTNIGSRGFVVGSCHGDPVLVDQSHRIVRTIPWYPRNIKISQQSDEVNRVGSVKKSPQTLPRVDSAANNGGPREKGGGAISGIRHH